MADIKIDIKRVRNANYAVPAMISSLDRSERAINLMKWRIPEEIQERRDIKNRLALIVRKMKQAESKLGEFYKFTEDSINRYLETDRGLNNQANSDFI